MGRRRGTEYEGVASPVPPGQSIPKKQPRGIANAGSGTPIIPPLAPSEVDRQAQEWTVTDEGVTSNSAGHGITVLDVSTVNSKFQGLAYTFPNDGSTDDNSWTIDVVLPTFMSATPNMKIRLFVQATGAGAC